MKMKTKYYAIESLAQVVSDKIIEIEIPDDNLTNMKESLKRKVNDLIDSRLNELEAKAIKGDSDSIVRHNLIVLNRKNIFNKLFENYAAILEAVVMYNT